MSRWRERTPKELEWTQVNRKEVTALDRMLAKQGDVTTGDWRKEMLEKHPPSPSPAFLHIRVDVNGTLATSSSKCAALAGVSRAEWIRRLMAEQVEQELGIPRERLLAMRNGGVPRRRAVKERLEGERA